MFNKFYGNFIFRNINLGLFENMHVLPSDGWLKGNHNLDFNIFSIKERFDCGVIKHSFTHFDLDSKVILLKVDDNKIKLKLYTYSLN